MAFSVLRPARADVAAAGLLGQPLQRAGRKLGLSIPMA